MNRSLERKIRRILIVVFGLSLLVAAGVGTAGIYLAVRDEHISQMRSQVDIVQNLIDDYMLGYDDHILGIIRQSPEGSVDEVKSYLKKALHLHEPGDIYYLLDQNQRIVLISPPYESYEGMSISPKSFHRSSAEISDVHQSLFSDKTVITIQYPMAAGMTLIFERDLQSINRIMSSFDKSKVFDNQAIFVLTSEGKVAYHPETRLVKSRHNLAVDMRDWKLPVAGNLVTYQLYGQKYMAFKKILTVPRGWTIYYSVPAGELLSHVEKIVLSQLVMLFVFFGVVYFILQQSLNRYFSRPVRQIVKSLALYNSEKPGEVIEPEMSCDVQEFSAIIDAINAMSAQVNSSNTKLRRSEEQSRLLLNSTAEAIYGLDTQGRCTFCNRSFMQMMGYGSEAELLGQEMHQLIHHSHADGRAYPLDKCLAHKGFLEGMGSHIDNEVLWRADGSSFAVEYWSYPIFQGDQIIGAVVTFIDITRRKQAEEQLAEEKEQLAVTLRSIGDAVITTDTAGKIVLVNRVAEELTGWPQHEAGGRPLPEVFHIIDEHSRKSHESPVDRVIKNGAIVDLANHSLLIARDGTERAIADSGAPIRDTQGRIVGVVLVFRDVTQSRKIQEEAFKARKLESIGVLAGGIAHDFNNILTAIMGNISLAGDMAVNDKQKSLLASAEKASVRAKGLTQQLLTFAKGGQPVTETSSISEVIRESAGFVLHGSNVACSFVIPDNLRLVNIDRGQISQVIQNIVLNAKDAMPEGGNIEIVCENYRCSPGDHLPLPEGEYVLINIRDTGTGIPPEIIDKIFDPYFTASEHGQGLGLAVTRSIIAKHGGHVGVESKVGAGSVFTIYLPVSEDCGKMQNEDAAAWQSSTGRVLIMDDEEIIREVMKTMIQQLGYGVLAAGDGQEMLAMYQQAAEAGKPVDVVILDLTIPGGMGGKEAMKKLLQKYPQARAVVVSGYYNDPVMADCASYGFKAAVAKPFQVEELGQALRKAME
ncbi:MAG: PAS domain S-box protein [Desulfobulbaceae bacterium]|nr:PAS domain S-box protein [Desulfobulbaceae bacterium]